MFPILIYIVNKMESNLDEDDQPDHKMTRQSLNNVRRLSKTDKKYS